MLEDVSTLVAHSRQRKGWSIEELAVNAQISVSELVDLEAGQSGQLFEWSIIKATRLADALDVKLSQLVGETMLNYDEWALVWTSLIEYSVHRPGLNMKADMKDLIQKVQSFIPDHQSMEHEAH